MEENRFILLHDFVLAIFCHYVVLHFIVVWVFLRGISRVVGVFLSGISRVVWVFLGGISRGVGVFLGGISRVVWDFLCGFSRCGHGGPGFDVRDGLRQGTVVGLREQEDEDAGRYGQDAKERRGKPGNVIALRQQRNLIC